jgi:transcriptional regulator with XRE-family HTH domain
MSESSVGDRLRQLRSERGLTQREVAIGADVVEKTVIRAENTGAMNVETLTKLSEFFGVSADYLLRGDAPDTASEPLDDESRPLVDQLLAARRDFSDAKRAWIRTKLEETDRLTGDDPDRVWDEIKALAAVYEYETGRKLPLPERERAEEPKKAKGESIRGAVLGKKPKR